MDRQIQHRHNNRSVIIICGIIISAISFILIHNHPSFKDGNSTQTLNSLEYPLDNQMNDLVVASNTCVNKKDSSKKELNDPTDPQVHFNFLTSFLEVESNAAKTDPNENDEPARGVKARLGSIYSIFSSK